MVESLIHPVGYRPVCEQGCKAIHHPFQEITFSAHVQVTRLLSRKRGCRQILGSGTTSHGNIHTLSKSLFQLPIGNYYFLFQVSWAARMCYQIPQLLASVRQILISCVSRSANMPLI